MISLLTFILSCWGLTHIIVSGKILDDIRNYIIIKSRFLGDLITCHQCTGLWVGMALSFLFPNLHDVIPGFGFILYGFISSGTCSLIISVIYMMNRVGRN